MANEARPRLRATHLGATLLVSCVALAATAVGCGDSPRVTSSVSVGSTGGAGGSAVVHDGPDVHVTINELMAKNALTVQADGNGLASSWVELYSDGEQEIPLAGYALTDDFANPGKGPIGEGVVLPPHGHVVLWLDGDTAAGPTHVTATLLKIGGTLGLARPDGSFVARVSYGAQEVDFSAAREPDGSDHWAIEWHPTPGAPNATGAGQPMGPSAPDAPPEAVPAAGDLTETILGFDRMPELALEISGESLASLRREPRTYVPATLRYDGRDYGPIGVKLKGQESFEPIDRKPSLHINIDEYAPEAAFFGLKDLTLNNMHGDYSMMHERLAYWVARQAGVPASRDNHALLTVNGRFYGLYSNLETVKKRLMKQLFGDGDGTLYSTQDVELVPGDVPDFTVESGPDDRMLLAGLANALTASSGDEAMAGAADYADVAEFTRYWAVCAVVAQLDAFPYSNPGDDYFLYADPVTHKLFFLPWGADETFYSSSHDVTQVFSVMARKCKESPGCYQQFVSQTMDVLTLVEQLDWLGETDRIVAQIAPHAVMDANKWYTNDDVARHQSSMRHFVSERRARLLPMLR